MNKETENLRHRNIELHKRCEKLFIENRQLERQCAELQINFNALHSYNKALCHKLYGSKWAEKVYQYVDIYPSDYPVTPL